MLEPEDLPDGWMVKRLSDPGIALLNPKKSEINDRHPETEVTFVPMAGVDERSGTIASPQVRRLNDVKKGYTYFAENDVIFAKITPCMENGKCAIGRALRNGLGFGSTEFHVIRSGCETTPEWLYLVLRSQQVRDDAKNSMQGAAGQQRVPVEFLDELQIPVPPLAEQQRIFARVETITMRISKLAEHTAAIVDAVDRTLAALYERIVGGAISRPFGEVAKLVRRSVKTTSHSQYGEMGIRSFGKGTFQKPMLTTAQLGNKRIYRVHAGDLVFMNVFAWEGAIAVARPVDDGLVGSHRFMTHEVNPAVATPEFLCFHFLTPQGLEDIGAASPGSAGRNRTLGIHKLAKIEVPVPDIDDQRRFARMIRLQHELRRLQREVEADLATFTLAILAKAFRGEL